MSTSMNEHSQPPGSLEVSIPLSTISRGGSSASTDDERGAPRKGFAERTKAFSNRSKERFLLSGEHYKAFALFLDTRTTPRRYQASKSPSPVHVHINNASDTNTRRLSFDNIDGVNLFAALPQPDAHESHIVFLQGWLSPEWIRIIGAHCHIDPEFFRRHLDFIQYKEFYELPPLPSTSQDIWHLRITSICNIQLCCSDYSQRFESDREAVKQYQRDVRQRGLVGSSIVRRFATHDENTCTLEQNVTITIRQKKTGGWMALVWLDSGEPIDGSLFTSSALYGNPLPSYLPIIQHRSKVALDSKEPLRSTGSSAPDPTTINHTEQSLQSSSLLPSQYGTALDRDIMRADALYALSDLFEFAASSENQFVNLMQKHVDNTIQEFRGQEERSVASLRYCKELLDDHYEYTAATLRRLEHEDDISLPRTTNQAHLEVRKATLSRLREDFSYILTRNRTVSLRAKEGMETIMNDVLLEESRKGINQAKEVGRLTFLAFFFLPLSFVTSIFGMNVVEFKDWRVAVATIMACFLLVMAVSSMMVLWEYMPWKTHEKRLVSIQHGNKD